MPRGLVSRQHAGNIFARPEFAGVNSSGCRGGWQSPASAWTPFRLERHSQAGGQAVVALHAQSISVALWGCPPPPRATPLGLRLPLPAHRPGARGRFKPDIPIPESAEVLWSCPAPPLPRRFVDPSPISIAGEQGINRHKIIVLGCLRLFDKCIVQKNLNRRRFPSYAIF